MSWDFRSQAGYSLVNWLALMRIRRRNTLVYLLVVVVWGRFLRQDIMCEEYTCKIRRLLRNVCQEERLERLGLALWGRCWLTIMIVTRSTYIRHWLLLMEVPSFLYLCHSLYIYSRFFFQTSYTCILCSASCGYSKRWVDMGRSLPLLIWRRCFR